MTFAGAGAAPQRDGRPSVDPDLMIRMLLVGYCFGIRSERRPREEVHLNLAHRWFCCLDLADRVPHHSTFSKNRHGRFRDCDLLRHAFEATVRLAGPAEEGSIWPMASSSHDGKTIRHHTPGPNSQDDPS